MTKYVTSLLFEQYNFRFATSKNLKIELFEIKSCKRGQKNLRKAPKLYKSCKTKKRTCQYFPL